MIADIFSQFTDFGWFNASKVSIYFSPTKEPIDGHVSRVFACAFNPKSHHELISGGWDDMVMCWDDRQPFATKYFKGIHICGEGLDFDKPGRQVWKSIF